MLNGALNRGPKPKVIADDILVEELGMGTIPPELEILEIGDLGTDRFRGIFRLTYAGDAHLVLKTKVQANPLSKPSRPDIGLFPSSNASRGILFAAAPLIVPMHLRLSSVKLRAIVVLVVSKAKGITLVFKNDPLESVEVSSTFDSVAVIQKYLQQEIEGQLREMFREDLPGIIHRLSQKWLSGEVKTEKENAKQKASAEEPSQRPQPSRPREPPLTRSASAPLVTLETASAPGGTLRRSHSKGRKSQQGRSSESVAASMAASTSRSPPKPRSGPRRPRHVAKSASTSAALLHNELPNTHASPFDAAFPDIENYDPTYGLRPDDLPTHSGFSGLGRLAQRGSAGLKDLTASPTLGMGDNTQGRVDLDLDGAAVFEDFDRHSDDVESDLDAEHDANRHQEEGDRTDDDVTTDSELEGASDDAGDDVSDLDVNEQSSLVDTSIDYTRFGYPPASAAFSDTHELNRASSIIFDDEPQSSTKRGKRSSLSGRPASATRRPSSSKSERSTTSSAQRRKPQPEVVYETIPAVGGGTITRPRVYHIASKVQPPEVDWDDEDTARPSQYGGTPSTRTGATRFGSDYGAHSSRSNTVRGIHDSPQLGAAFVSRDSSDESLLDLPPESYHSSDASLHQQALNSHDGGRSTVSGSTSRRGLAEAGPSSISRESSYRDMSVQDLQWDHSAAVSTAPTSSQSQNWSDAASRVPSNTVTSSETQSTSGIKFRKNKSANHQRSKTMGNGDHVGFLPQRSGEGPGQAATPARNRAPAASRPGFITYATSPPGDLNSWQHSPPQRAHTHRDAAFSTSPNGAQDMLSISPFRDSSLHHGSPRGAANVAGPFASASNSPQTVGQSGRGAHGSGVAPTHLSIDASAHFLDLVKSNHTLSPFTRNMEHFTVRSAPVTPGWQTTSGSASVVGSSAASGTGTTSGSSQTGALAKHGYSSSKNSGGKTHSRKQSSDGRTHHEQRTQQDSDALQPNSALPARRRRTFQLGSAKAHDDPSTSASESPEDSRESSPFKGSAGDTDEYGFSRFAGSGPKAFQAPGSDLSSTSSTKGLRSGIKDARRRSRPDSMGPPSEAARMSALRWEAIRE